MVSFFLCPVGLWENMAQGVIILTMPVSLIGHLYNDTFVKSLKSWNFDFYLIFIRN
jgi:hypothetical protein